MINVTFTHHPVLLPDWKREPCLACGHKVKRARGSWVEIIGDRSGAWLGAYPTAAALATTTADELPTQEIFLLGAAHRACLDAAFLRIRRGDLVFAETLPRVTVEHIDESEVTPVLLPSGPYDCLFCDTPSGGITEEHIWPAWLQREIVKRGGQFPQYGRGRTRSAMGPKTRACHACNTRWMSTLEIDASPLIIDMFDHSRTLDETQREVLATWATKMAFLFDGSGINPVAIRGLAHDLRISRKPPNGVWVWISGYVDSDHLLSAWVKPLRLEPMDGTRPEEPNGLCVTFTLFRIVFQVVITFYRGTYKVDAASALEHALLPIWPIENAIPTWPPAKFSANSIQHLVDRMADGT